MRAAIVAGRQEEELLESGLAEAIGEPSAGHARGGIECVLVLGPEGGAALPELVNPMRKLASYLRLE
jgi:hypothetical protein